MSLAINFALMILAIFLSASDLGQAAQVNPPGPTGMP
jgi:hypothetical protein